MDKASKLISDPDSVTPAPGLVSSRMVYSSSNPKKPHLVTFFKSGKMMCDCQNCSIKHICSHILATAEKLNILQSFMEWYKKENKDISLWKLARSSGVPKSPGSKPQTRKRSRKVLPPVKTASQIRKRATSQFTSCSSSSPEKRVCNTLSSTSTPPEKRVCSNPYPPYYSSAMHTPYGCNPYMPPMHFGMLYDNITRTLLSIISECRLYKAFI